MEASIIFLNIIINMMVSLVTVHITFQEQANYLDNFVWSVLSLSHKVCTGFNVA